MIVMPEFYFVNSLKKKNVRYLMRLVEIPDNIFLIKISGKSFRNDVVRGESTNAFR